jgi:hypothetical protein
MSELLGTFQKDPDETADYYVEWSAALGTDTISTSSWVTPDGLTQEVSPAPGISGTTTYIWLSGGTSPTDYSVENTIETTGGRTFQGHLLMQVR